MTAAEIVKELKTLGSESTKRVLMNHGAREPFFGVKVEDLKKIRHEPTRPLSQLVRELNLDGKL